MTIFDAMYTGVSGLDAESSALGVIGNNVANANTVGFKESRAIFENVMGSAAGPAQIGGGVRMASTQQIFAQGSLQNTGNATDVALQGDGFFVVNGSVGGTTGNFYTRAGQTSLNSNGTLVNPDGLALQGYTVLPNGQMSTQIGNISVKAAALAPKASATLNIAANLDANAPIVPAFNPTNPSATSNGTEAFTTYDSLGTAHKVDVYFSHTAANTWTYNMVANDATQVQGGNPDLGSGSLTFDSTGALSSAPTSPTAVNWTDGANAQTLALNVGTPTTTPGGTGRDGLTQNSGSGSTSAIDASVTTADGYSSGDLSGVTVGSDGTVSGVYTNGQTLAVGQLAIAKFQANDGLASAGQNLWSATQQSGTPAVGAAGTGGRGGIQSGALEQSNVDIASQFVDLIAHQQGFEANSKTITTVNQMLSTLQQMVQ